jgi:CheY-like chemotaxis protein
MHRRAFVTGLTTLLVAPLETGTGEEGVQLARQQHPALVLMDIRLAGISGVEAFGQLRAARTIAI